MTRACCSCRPSERCSHCKSLEVARPVIILEHTLLLLILLLYNNHQLQHIAQALQQTREQQRSSPTGPDSNSRCKSPAIELQLQRYANGMSSNSKHAESVASHSARQSSVCQQPIMPGPQGAAAFALLCRTRLPNGTSCSQHCTQCHVCNNLLRDNSCWRWRGLLLLLTSPNCQLGCSTAGQCP